MDLEHLDTYWKEGHVPPTAEDLESVYRVIADALPIARRELPNLLHAVHRALDADDADAVRFVDRVNWFLTVFGMTRKAALLTRLAIKMRISPLNDKLTLTEKRRSGRKNDGWN